MPPCPGSGTTSTCPTTSTSTKLADALTDLGLKLEALERPGDAISGPLVVGRVLTMEPEPQKNGKTINWCTVDVADANGTGEPQGIVCGAHNFAPGDLVVVVLPGGVLPGGFEISARKTYGHVSAGMICSAAELGLGEDHDGIIVLPAGAGEPGEDARPVLGLDDTVMEFEINPDRAYALSMRGVAREAALAVRTPASATRSSGTCRRPTTRATRSTSRTRPAARSSSPAPSPGSTRRAPTPDWLARRIAQAGMRPISLAVDVTNYVMLETGRPIHGYDAAKVQGAIGVRRARDGERLTTLDGTVRTLAAGPDGTSSSPTTPGSSGSAGSWAARTPRCPETTTRVLVEAAHWDPVSMYRTGRRHKITSEAGKRNERGVDPTICEAAADRVVELLTTYGGGTRRARRHRGRRAARRRRRSRSRSTCRRGSRASPSTSDTTVRNLEAIGCEVVRRRAGRRADRDRAAVAARPERPLRPGRGGRPDRRLRQRPVGAARPLRPAAG